MAILQSNNGQFYQVPDEEAEKFLVPADKVEETLRAAGAGYIPGNAWLYDCRPSR